MPRQDSPWKALSLVSIIGIDIALCTSLGVWLGRKADLYFHTSPILMIVGLFIGLGIGIMMIVPLMKKYLGE